MSPTLWNQLESTMEQSLTEGCAVWRKQRVYVWEDGAQER